MMAVYVVCILLFLLLVYKGAERMTATAGRPIKLYTSGATMRHLSQFSSSDQGHVVLHELESNKTVPLLVAPTAIVNPDLYGVVKSDAHLYTSGATMRVLDQVFSSTDQGVPVSVHNVEDPNAPPLYLEAAMLGR